MSSGLDWIDRYHRMDRLDDKRIGLDWIRLDYTCSLPVHPHVCSTKVHHQVIP